MVFDLRLKNEEYWVMRIVEPLSERALAQCAAQLKSGAFQIIGDDIVEPLSVHDDSEDALVAAQAVTARTGHSCKVVLNADL